MDKCTKKGGTHKIYNRDITSWLKRKYGVSGHYLYASLRGDRVSDTSEQILKDYKRAEELTMFLLPPLFLH